MVSTSVDFIVKQLWHTFVMQQKPDTADYINSSQIIYDEYLQHKECIVVTLYCLLLLGGVHPEYDQDSGTISHPAQLFGCGHLLARQPLYRPLLLR